MEDSKLYFINAIHSKLWPVEQNWVKEKVTALAINPEKFPIFFSLATRHISNDVPDWSPSELLELDEIYPGFGKTRWSKRDLVRTQLLLSLKEPESTGAIKSFFEIAEMNELVALYKGLYLLENAKEFKAQLKEGVRTNMVNVFDAICLGNPFAATYLEDQGWNQMILKAVFMERPLYKVQDIDKRRNKELADMLQDYIQERWAANRPVSPEIWRMVHKDLRNDIRQALLERKFEGLEKQAVDAILGADQQGDKEFWNSIGKMNEINIV